MIDIQEATKSINFYTVRLDQLYRLYEVAAGIAQGKKIDEAVSKQVTAARDKVIADLTRVQKEGQALRIVTLEAVTKERERLLHAPQALADYLNALVPHAAAINRAGALLHEHEQKEVEKRRANAETREEHKLSETTIALRAFIEKRNRERKENRASHRREFKRKYFERWGKHLEGYDDPVDDPDPGSGEHS